MTLPYLDESILNPDGVACRVLDSTRVDFSRAAAYRKTALTLIRQAQGGERIETKNNNGDVESVYVARAGDAIFVNLHNPDDIYVPGNSDGTRWQFNELKSRGYVIVGEDNEKGGLLARNDNTSIFLPAAIAEPTCIKNAWGEGLHQFLFAGAALKNEGGRVTGIDKDSFEKTWTPATQHSAAPAPRSTAHAFKPK